MMDHTPGFMHRLRSWWLCLLHEATRSCKLPYAIVDWAHTGNGFCCGCHWSTGPVEGYGIVRASAPMIVCRTGNDLSTYDPSRAYNERRIRHWHRKGSTTAYRVVPIRVEDGVFFTLSHLRVVAKQ